jgi:hypothetical protein
MMFPVSSPSASKMAQTSPARGRVALSLRISVVHAPWLDQGMAAPLDFAPVFW